MEQLYCFSASQGKASTGTVSSVWRLFVDGASRGNPGPSGAGVWLTKDGQDVVRKGYFLGKVTNNQAEYTALLIGIFFAHKKMGEGDKIIISSDSQLIIRQLQGVYRVKTAHIVPLYQQAITWLTGLKYTLRHVMRDKNQVADGLANDGVDTKRPLPTGFTVPTVAP
jgi:ribonuclease HI